MQTSTKGMPVRGEDMFQEGGILKGPKHEKGGIKAIVGGKKLIEMEGGEYVSSAKATNAFGKDNYAYINDLGNNDPAAARKLGKEVKMMAKDGGDIATAADGGDIREIAESMGYGGDIEKYGLGDWIKKRLKPSKKIKKAVGRAKTGLEKAGNWLETAGRKMTGHKYTDKGFETDEQYTKRKEKEKTDWATDKAKKAKSTDAYLRMLAKTSEEKRKKANFGTSIYDLANIQSPDSYLSGFLKKGGSISTQDSIINEYAVEDYKSGGSIVTGGCAGDPVAVYNNKKN